MVDNVRSWPEYAPLYEEPSEDEVKDAIRSTANRKAVGLDELPAQLLKALLGEDHATFQHFCIFGKIDWMTGQVLQGLKDASLEVLHIREDMTECGN